MRFNSIGLAILLLMVPTMTFAAKNTQFSAIGYSQDRQFFAYEEYGVDKDGGEAFSKVYIINIGQISQVIGTPIIYRANISEQPIEKIRQQALENAQTFLHSLEITQPAMIVAMIGDWQIMNEENVLEFGIAGTQNQVDFSEAYRLKLETFQIEATAECATFSDAQTMGFSLDMQEIDLSDKDSELLGEADEIYRDDVLARSRQCPLIYNLKAIISPFGENDIKNSLAMISVYSISEFGFSRNYLAIPLIEKP